MSVCEMFVSNEIHYVLSKLWFSYVGQLCCKTSAIDSMTYNQCGLHVHVHHKAV